MLKVPNIQSAPSWKVNVTDKNVSFVLGNNQKKVK